MIKHFLALSVGLHALAGALMPNAFRAPLQLEVPALDVTLAAASSRAEADAKVETARVRASEPVSRPVMTAAPAEPGAVAGEARSPTATGQPEAAIENDQGESRRANHLLSLLQTTLGEHFIYPSLARKHGWEGIVYLGLRLNTNGDLSALRLVRSSGYAILDRDALATLERIGTLPQARVWLDGRPFETELTVTYRLE